MTTNLLESITKQLTPEMMQHVSTLVGETPAHTQKAIDGASPTLLAGLMHLSSSKSGATQLLNLINQGNYGSLLNNLSGLLDEGNTAQTLMASGRDVLSTLFAGKLSAISDVIARASGVTSASASSLLSIAAPVVLGVLGRVRATQGLDASGLASLLMDQKDLIFRMAPAGLAGVLGVSDGANLGAGPAGVTDRMASNAGAHVTAKTVRQGSVLKQWLWPVLGLLVLGGLLYSFLGGRTEVVQAPALTPPLSATSTSVAAPVTLPGGTTLSLKEGSLTYNLATFLGDSTTTTVPKTLVFDHLSFASGTTKLTTESEQTVKDLSAILQAYPAADVRLDGYTDSVGDAGANKRLSLDRAEAVKDALAKSGIGMTRMTTAGYGQEHPLASNDTEDGRAKNRRLELVVMKK